MSDATVNETPKKNKISMARPPLPGWMDYGVMPVVNIATALIVSGIIIWFLGINPLEAINYMINGALGDSYSLGYTLYYTTNFIFT
ncbi:MAG: hypothetical protein R3261_09300, partial [Alphaproteobacteria bacterium]|nr:hypothetical protein [Alphaproteobacteria bacterium]